MSVVYIFEDNENMTSSALLKESFNGNNIHFSNGNSMMYRKLRSIYNTSDTFILFLDVVVDNLSTIKLYENLLIKCEDLENVYIVPILCIEYYILKMLDEDKLLFVNQQDEELVKYLVRTFDCNELSKEKQEIKTTLEKRYKYILNNQLCNCMKNIHIDNVSSSSFYLSDCVCESNCDFAVIQDSLLKSEKLITSLPIFDVISAEHKDYLENHGIKIRPIDFESALAKVQDFYAIIKNSLKSEYNLKVTFQNN